MRSRPLFPALCGRMGRRETRDRRRSPPVSRFARPPLPPPFGPGLVPRGQRRGDRHSRHPAGRQGRADSLHPSPGSCAGTEKTPPPARASPLSHTSLQECRPPASGGPPQTPVTPPKNAVPQPEIFSVPPFGDRPAERAAPAGRPHPLGRPPKKSRAGQRAKVEGKGRAGATARGTLAPKIAPLPGPSAPPKAPAPAADIPFWGTRSPPLRGGPSLHCPPSQGVIGPRRPLPRLPRSAAPSPDRRIPPKIAPSPANQKAIYLNEYHSLTSSAGCAIL